VGIAFQKGAMLNLKLQKQCLNSYWLTLHRYKWHRWWQSITR